MKSLIDTARISQDVFEFTFQEPEAVGVITIMKSAYGLSIYVNGREACMIDLFYPSPALHERDWEEEYARLVLQREGDLSPIGYLKLLPDRNALVILDEAGSEIEIGGNPESK